MFKKTITQLFILIIVIGAVFLANGLILAWSPPPGSPPDPNAPAPINVGSTSQYKSGALGVGGVFRGYSSAIFDGTIRFSGFTSCDSLGTDASGNLTCSGGALCTPDCSGRVCGADPVCGQSCGPPCDVGYTCNVSGECIADVVTYTYSYTAWVAGSCSGCEGTQNSTRQCLRSDSAYVDCSYCGGVCTKTESCGGPCYYWGWVGGSTFTQGLLEVTAGGLCSPHCDRGKVYVSTVCSDGENDYPGWRGQPGCTDLFALYICLEIGEHYTTNCW